MIEAAENYETRRRYLPVAFQAEIRIPFVKEFARNRPVRVVAHRAAFPKGFVLEDPRAGLLPVAPAAGCVYPGGEGLPGTVDVLSVRIMAIGAGHPVFSQRVMVPEIELRFHRQVTAEAGPRIPLRIYYVHSPPAARLDVQAAGAVTGFASLQALCIREKQMPVIGHFETLRHFPMTHGASLHPHEIGPLYQRRRRRGLHPGGTGGKDDQDDRSEENDAEADCRQLFHILSFGRIRTAAERLGQ
jgi:hypothetical protein